MDETGSVSIFSVVSLHCRRMQKAARSERLVRLDDGGLAQRAPQADSMGCGGRC